MTNDSQALVRLEQEARRLRDSLPENHDPVVVEFAGVPKAGKSTTIEIVAHFFRRMGFKVWAPTEGASKRTPYHLKRDLVAFNTWTLNYAISELLVAYFNIDHHNLILLDRGPYDSLAWMGVLSQQQSAGTSRGSSQVLTKEEYDIFRSFATQTRWSQLVSRVFLFKCTPDISLEREHESKLTQKHGTAMNPLMLKALLQEYEDLENKGVFQSLYTVETSRDTNPKSTSCEVALEICQALGERE